MSDQISLKHNIYIYIIKTIYLYIDVSASVGTPLPRGAVERSTFAGAAKEREDHGTDLQVMARILFGGRFWLVKIC